MTAIALQPDEVERHRRENAARLSLFEIPALRATGLFFLSIGILLNNRYFLHDLSLTAWLNATVVMGAYCAVSWVAIVIAWRKGRDLTLFFLIADMIVWTYAIYASGAEQSRLYFILLLRVADQTQTTFRRCLAFVGLGIVCYSGMVAWAAFVDGRAVDAGGSAVKLIFIAVSGLYIALAARTAERRRLQVRTAIHMSHDLIRQLEERSVDLREARAKAEEANAAKSEFLANMSHEMRTPLHGVIGMLQLAHDGEMSGERARHIDLARQSAESLLGTIDDVLEFSKIEARKLDLEPVYFSVRELLQETMKPLGVTAAAKGLVISCVIDSDVPDAIWTDPLRLRQIVTNLVGNAIKFTQSGEISVRIRCERLEENRLLLRGEVEDTGIGVDPSLQRLIFEPFTQVDSSRTRRYAGTGLGLSIVARLVEAMGGSIDVESSEQKGSRFAFSIAAETDRFAAPERPQWEKGLAGRRVLVVDHHDRERGAVEQMLTAHGMRVDTAAWFDEAPEQPYEVVVATEPRNRYRAVVVIRSPLEHDPTGESLSRPVEEHELIEAVGAALGLITPERLRVVRMSSRLAARRLRVLVVEDHPIGQEFAVEALRRMGHSAVIAANGSEAVSLADREHFDAILMDVQMPGMDGLEATRHIRAREGGARIPIIAMTAHTRPEERTRCLEAGMDAVLTKPIDRRELADMLRDIAPEERTVLDSVGGNTKLLARVRAAFAEQTPLLVAAIEEAIEQADAEALCRHAHKLKGSVSHFEGEAMNLAARLENSGRTGDFAAARALMPQLEEALRELGARLAAAG